MIALWLSPKKERSLPANRSLVSFLKLGGISGKLVFDFAPETVEGVGLKHVAVFLDRHLVVDRHELEGPEDNLSEMPHDRAPIERT